MLCAAPLRPSFLAGAFCRFPDGSEQGHETNLPRHCLARRAKGNVHLPHCWVNRHERGNEDSALHRAPQPERGPRANNSSDEYPPTPLLAFFLRYPNPFARHVLCVDVLSRTIDPQTGQIRTLRLILKRGLVPAWASKWLPLPSGSGGRGLDAWVLEESVVDPPGWGFDGSPEEIAAKRDEARRKRERSKGRMKVEDEEQYLCQPRLKSTQGNLSHKKFMHVVEGAELCSGREG